MPGGRAMASLARASSARPCCPCARAPHVRVRPARGHRPRLLRSGLSSSLRDDGGRGVPAPEGGRARDADAVASGEFDDEVVGAPPRAGAENGTRAFGDGRAGTGGTGGKRTRRADLTHGAPYAHKHSRAQLFPRQALPGAGREEGNRRARAGAPRRPECHQAVGKGAGPSTCRSIVVTNDGLRRQITGWAGSAVAALSAVAAAAAAAVQA